MEPATTVDRNIRSTLASARRLELQQHAKENSDHGSAGRRQDHVGQAPCSAAQRGSFQRRRRPGQRQQELWLFGTESRRARAPDGVAVRPSGESGMFCAMMLDHAQRHRHLIVFLGLMAASLAGLLLLPPIPQVQSYHQFADQRALLGVPNFWNVVSNLPFIAIGAAGLWRCRDDSATIVLFLGIFLTGFGSTYYHWNPTDGTLFWDRLPMTLAFTAILAGAVEERLS